jgi:heterodisulfide reductase subunit C
MNINRNKAGTHLTEALASEINALQGPCVGCSKCTGLCNALIDALVLPDLILSRKSSRS